MDKEWKEEKKGSRNEKNIFTERKTEKRKEGKKERFIYTYKVKIKGRERKERS